MGETAAATIGEPYAMIEAATHAMTKPVAEFVVPAIIGAIGAVGLYP
jgi:hypothetical protein